MKLTRGEKIRILRRRNGISMKDAAKRHGLSMRQYRYVEEDVEGAPLLEVPDIGELATHEELYIRRLRYGMRQADVAKQLGISRYWLGEKERGRAALIPGDAAAWPKRK